MNTSGLVFPTEYLSRYSVFLRMFSETSMELGVGTGFVYEHEDVYYLITNGHNVTGVNPETGKRESAHAAFPIRMKLSLRMESPEGGSEMMVPDGLDVNLYSDDYFSTPAWYMHPHYGYKVDVVAIVLGHKSSFDERIHFYPINLYRLFRARPKIADNVFVMGYPFGITDPLHIPIWKRGSIATEPGVDFRGLPRLLIDTASRPGMSGSPVIIMRAGFHRPEEMDFVGEPIMEPLIGIIYGFVGIYSGRIGAKGEYDVQLGIVWKKEVIGQILAAKTIGVTNFHHE